MLEPGIDSLLLLRAALAFGGALSQALGDRKGIHRFGDFSAPLDEALVHVVLVSAMTFCRPTGALSCVARSGQRYQCSLVCTAVLIEEHWMLSLTMFTLQSTCLGCCQHQDQALLEVCSSNFFLGVAV